LYNVLQKSINPKDPSDEFTFEMVISTALQTATGMIYLHAKNIQHRDLKSLNLLVDANNKIKISGNISNFLIFAYTRNNLFWLNDRFWPKQSKGGRSLYTDLGGHPELVRIAPFPN